MHRFTRFAVSAALSAGIVSATLLGFQPAQASTLGFDLSGVHDASWSLDSNPALNGFSFTFSSGNWVTFFNVAGTADDSPYLFASLTFWASSGGGGVVAGDGSGGSQNFNQEGDQIYSGPESAPIFSEGTFNLCHDGPALCDSLTVSASIGDSPDLITTPLPSTWLMLLSGFLGLGFFAYRSTKKRTAALAAA